ncbi:MAG: LmeA family phospholipid-binding protein [Vampirovibrionales bacterium]|nr:LmeA family phospholipid-binding protein [Vampirovibrionales bacterium]
MTVRLTLSPRRASIIALSALFCLQGLVFAEGVTPLNAGSASMVDLPNTSAKAITLDIEDARFASRSVGRLKLEAQGVDFRNGALNSLRATMQSGYFDNNLKVDELALVTRGFSFDPMELLNHQRFLLTQPVTADVHLTLSEDNLNAFFSNPKTIEKLENAIARKTAGVKLVTLSNPSLTLRGKDAAQMNLTVVVGQAVAAPMQLDGKLGVNNGKLAFRDLAVTASQAALPVDVSRTIEKELNKAIDIERLGKDDFQVRAERLTFGRKLIRIDGTASLTRLSFGKN